MTSKVTMADVAFDVMSKRKKEIEFVRLFQEVAKKMDIPEAQLARKKRQFYSEMMEDRRFAPLAENKWDLRSRRKYEEVNAETVDLEDEDEEEERDLEDVDALDIPKSEEEF